MKRQSAEILAKDVLVWLSASDDLLPVFLNATGSDAASVRQGIDDPEFLGAVLDFLLLDDAWVVEFCTAQGLPFTAPSEARAVLPGGEAVHWT